MSVTPEDPDTRVLGVLTGQVVMPTKPEDADDDDDEPTSDSGSTSVHPTQ